MWSWGSGTEAESQQAREREKDAAEAGREREKANGSQDGRVTSAAELLPTPDRSPPRARLSSRRAFSSRCCCCCYCFSSLARRAIVCAIYTPTHAYNHIAASLSLSSSLDDASFIPFSPRFRGGVHPSVRPSVVVVVSAGPYYTSRGSTSSEADPAHTECRCTPVQRH